MRNHHSLTNVSSMATEAEKIPAAISNSDQMTAQESSDDAQESFTTELQLSLLTLGLCLAVFLLSVDRTIVAVVSHTSVDARPGLSQS